MRGKNDSQTSMLCLISTEDRVPRDHPLREVKRLADVALKRLSPDLDAMYSSHGRPSIPPERLLKAMLLMAFYSIRSERMFCEHLDYNLLFRWFLDMDMIEPAFDHSTFSQRNRDRLLEHDVGRKFFAEVVAQAKAANLMSSEHFSVDGTLIEAWASLKSFRPKDGSGKNEPPDDPGNPTVDFRGEKRSNDTHASTTDPEALLARKSHGTTAKLSYCMAALMENRNGLLLDLAVAPATGTAEVELSYGMLERNSRPGVRRTCAGDKLFDQKDFVAGCRALDVTPHVAQKSRGSAIDLRTTRHAGYAISQRIRKRIEEIFGWAKTVGGFRRTRFKGRRRTELAALFVGIAYNLVRMVRLMPRPA